MVYTCDVIPRVSQKVFKCMTRIKIQVRGAGTVFLGSEQGEVANPSDGVMLTQADTAPPWDTWWKGDLWYRSDTLGQQFVVIQTGREVLGD